MTYKKNISLFTCLPLLIAGILFLPFVTSCGKQSTNNAAGLNIQYQILNLSPDLFPVNLFVDFHSVNRFPYIYQGRQGYFYVTSIDTPYQIRSNLTSGETLLSRDDVLKSSLKYTLFISGTRSDGSLVQTFTIDTSSSPSTGRGKVRFVNVSPSAISGLDVFANGTKAFSKSVYKSVSKYIELPIGNYDFQFTATGSATVIKDMPGVTIQDGRLYTLYAYGYTTRTDTAVFNTGEIVNK